VETARGERKPAARGRKSKLQRILHTGRTGLLVILVVSLINQLLLLLNIKYYLLFGASVPYYLNWLGQELSIYHQVTAYKVIAVLLSLIVYGMYVRCWVKSAKNWKYMRIGLMLYVVDTVFMVIFALVFLQNPLSCILWFFAHLVGVVVLYRAANAGEQLAKRARRKAVTQE
jgi:hypothetical protein